MNREPKAQNLQAGLEFFSNIPLDPLCQRRDWVLWLTFCLSPSQMQKTSLKMTDILQILIGQHRKSHDVDAPSTKLPNHTFTTGFLILYLFSLPLWAYRPYFVAVSAFEPMTDAETSLKRHADKGMNGWFLSSHIQKHWHTINWYTKTYSKHWISHSIPLQSSSLSVQTAF